MEIRAEKPEDISAIRNVNIAAFGQANEANLVDRLRAVFDGRLQGITSTVSFVAVESGHIVGHIFYSPVEIPQSGRSKNEGECADHLFMLGLAPLAVLPAHQRQGIGSLLIRRSLEACARLGCKAVVVLGHPTYYPRFGFVPARTKGLRCEYTVPDEAFMVLELERGALEGCSGTVKYRSEFQAFL
jgi:putative acetyltransferase